MRTLEDQLGRIVAVPQAPQRIVSLVPSQTELLFELGVGERVVGVTRYCTDPPEGVARCTDIGGTKKFRFDAIDALSPDLIIGNKEENYQEGIERLAERYPVWMSDIYDLDDALAMIRSVGNLVEATAPAEALVQAINERRVALGAAAAEREPVPTAYLIWRKPWMVAATDTFADHVMRLAGLENAFGHASRYPELDDAQLAACGAQLVLLSSEPFPFTAAHVDELQQLLPAARVELVDGTHWTWYGSRLLPALGAVQSLVDGLTAPKKSRG